jgi:hypothetical protein
MPRRPPKTVPELQAHKEWLGYLQPRGLVVAPAAMWEAGWVLEQSGKELLERQEQFREALHPLGHEEDVEDDQPRGFRRLEALLVEQLSWDADALQRDKPTLQIWSRELPELGETLAPTAVVRGFGADDKPQLLIQELPKPLAGQLPPGDPVDLDRRQASGDQGWRASPQERFERLLRETEVQLGLLFNGSQLRLVVAPKGESSGHLTFTLAELAQVSGRAMFAGLRLLLGREAVLDASPGLRLVDVIEASRNYQAVVSEELADQVLAGLWQLLRGFQRADQLTSAQGSWLPGDIRLNELAENNPQSLYGGLITVMLRLVFLLYAEDTDLMPNEPVFEQNYKLTTLLAQLQRDAAHYPDTMEQRYGAWSGICRALPDLLVEECLTARVNGDGLEPLEDAAALELLEAPASGNIDPGQRQQWLQEAVAELNAVQPALAALAERRADLAEEDHRRVREATLRTGESLRMRFRYEASLPGVIGLIVLLPAPVL